MTKPLPVDVYGSVFLGLVPELGHVLHDRLVVDGHPVTLRDHLRPMFYGRNLQL
jgi:hypothetical protein